jgi:tape measure domain-containing protein
LATIRTAIALYDGVTSPLRNMQKAMGIVLNSFESMQRASSNAVDVSAIQEAREELARAETAFDSIEQNIRDANDQQQRFNRSIRDGSSAADGLWQKMKGIAATVGGMIGLKQALGTSDQLTQTNARLNNALIKFDDGGSIKELEAKVMASAQRSRAYYMDTAAAVAKLGINARDAFTNMDEVIAFSELVNKSFVIGGAGAQEQSAAMLQLTQAMASGVLRGEELNSIFENAPGIIQSIAKYLDVPIGQIRTMASEGQITADIVKNAMFEAADDIENKFSNMPKTWGQIWTGMKNKALSMFAPILTKINQIANSTKFQQVTTALINGLAGVANVASSLLDILISVASVIVDNWSWIQPIIMGIVAAMLIYNGVALVTNAIMGIQATAKAVHAAATAMEAGATFTATVAQQGLNAALLACPLTWIILLIIAVIAAIYAACAAVAKFTGIANSGFGVICGGIMVVISFFKNLGLSVANIALGIWNALGACASNIGTAFHNVISNVQGWFYNLLSTALTVVAGICEALNKLPFVEFDYSGITSKASEYAAKSAEAYGNVEEYKSVADAFNEGMSTFDTFQDGWAADAFASGAAWGDGVADKVSGMFDFSALDSMGADSLDAFNLGNDLDSIYGNTGDIANNTAATADALDIAEEDLAYLRDIAEREAINRFTTAEIKVEQHNENHIASELDVDGIMAAWTESFAEQLAVSAEGVHE